MNRRRLILSATAALASLAMAPAAGAHHSFNMFDLNKLMTVSGTVSEYQYKMPHVWIYMDVPGAGGKPESWGFECHAPNLISRKGWKINTLKAGDKITLVMHPMKDGSKAGSVVRMILRDGRILWNAESDTRP